MDPFHIEPEGLQEFPKEDPTSAGVKITTGVMAIAGMATADQHGIGTGFEGFDDQVKVDPPRTGETDDSQVRRIFQPTRAGKVGTEIGTPVANKRNDFRFKKGWAAHRTTIMKYSMKFPSWIRPARQGRALVEGGAYRLTRLGSSTSFLHMSRNMSRE